MTTKTTRILRFSCGHKEEHLLAENSPPWWYLELSLCRTCREKSARLRSEIAEVVTMDVDALEKDEAAGVR